MEGGVRDDVEDSEPLRWSEIDAVFDGGFVILHIENM